MDTLFKHAFNFVAIVVEVESDNDRCLYVEKSQTK